MLLQEHTGLDHCSSCLTGNSLDRSSTSSLNLVDTDARGQTPLHRCISRGQGAFAKLLLSRYLTCSYLCHGCLLISNLFGCHFYFMAYQSYITFYVSHQSLFPHTKQVLLRAKHRHTDAIKMERIFLIPMTCFSISPMYLQGSRSKGCQWGREKPP